MVESSWRFREALAQRVHSREVEAAGILGCLEGSTLAALLVDPVVAQAVAIGSVVLLVLPAVLPEPGAVVVAVDMVGKVGILVRKHPADNHMADWAAGSSWGKADKRWEGSSPVAHTVVVGRVAVVGRVVHGIVVLERVAVRRAVVLDRADLDWVGIGLQVWAVVWWSLG